MLATNRATNPPGTKKSNLRITTNTNPPDPPHQNKHRSVIFFVESPKKFLGPSPILPIIQKMMRALKIYTLRRSEAFFPIHSPHRSPRIVRSNHTNYFTDR
jgi:hypothetical protein